MKTRKENTEVNETDREEIARQVADGNTSGHLDDGTGKRIYWEIKIECWKD